MLEKDLCAKEKDIPKLKGNLSPTELKETLLKTACQVGLDLVGVCGPEKFTEVETVLAKLDQEGYHAPFTPACRAERIDPKRVFPGVQSIIAVGMAYKKPGTGQSMEHSTGQSMEHSAEQSTEQSIELGKQSGSSEAKNVKSRGKFAHFAIGRDYHLVLREKMNNLMEQWQQSIGVKVNWSVQVDNGVLPDRAVAWRAGLGWYGQNCNIINPQFGSWLVLGELLIDIFLEPDKPVETSCKDCGLCLQACPTGALEGLYRLNAYRCISYLTQAPGFIPRNFRKAMGQQIYGCDLCQLVCPHNAKVKGGKHQEFSNNCVSMEWEPILESFLKLSNKEFASTYGRTTAGWRGKKLLQRNAIIALGNSGDPTVLPVLITALKDQRPEIRGHAAWSLAQLGGQLVKEHLELALVQEHHPEVRQEIAISLQELAQL